MSNINNWLVELVERNGVASEIELTPQMLKDEIEEVESAMQNEKVWCAGASDMLTARQHELNAAEHLIYIYHLREMMKTNENLEEICLCIDVYSDPDELPFIIHFLLPNGTGEDMLRANLAAARDKVDQAKYPDIEDHLFAVLNEAANSFDFSYWYCGELKSLRNRENLWNIE